jgi:HK97 family phage major capsid protein
MAEDVGRKAELAKALQVKVAANAEVADNFDVQGDTVVIEEKHRAEFAANMKDIKSIKGLIDDLEYSEKAASYDPDFAQFERESAAAEIAAKAAELEDAAKGVVPSFGSIGQAFLQSEEFKALGGGENGLTMNKSFELKSAGYNIKDVYSTLPVGPTGSGVDSFGRVQHDPFVQIPQRTVRVRDLFPARTTTAAVIEYFRVNGYTRGHVSQALPMYANAASVVPEYASSSFSLKPQTSLTFTGEQAPVRTIAHWEAAHRNVLADEPQLASIIDNELLYGLRLHEDAQILNGTGTSEDLTGLTSTAASVAGVQKYLWSAGQAATGGPGPGDNRADAIRRALTLSFLSYYEPTGVVVNPNDWEEIELIKDANGQYLMAVNIQQGAQARIWRVPVVETPAMTAGQAMVGAFGTGAQLYDREAPTIRIAEQHQDFFVRNAIVVLAEQRLALAIKRPEAFVHVTFDQAPA